MSRWSEVFVVAACGLSACGEHVAMDGGLAVDAARARDAAMDAPFDAAMDARPPLEPALAVSDRALALSTVVTIDSVTASEASWIVVTDEALRGITRVEAGEHTNVSVELDRPIVGAETLRAVLHADRGLQGSFEPDVDRALTDEMVFSATADASTPAARISVLNVGDSAWVFNAVEPSRYAVASDPSEANPPIVLRRGVRYEVFNPAYVSHPFELVGGANEVRLSQRLEGTLHDEPDVAFEIVSPALFRFTVTPSVEAAVEAYRCLIHPHMRGEVTFAAGP